MRAHPPCLSTGLGQCPAGFGEPVGAPCLRPEDQPRRAASPRSPSGIFKARVPPCAPRQPWAPGDTRATRMGDRREGGGGIPMRITRSHSSCDPAEAKNASGDTVRAGESRNVPKSHRARRFLELQTGVSCFSGLCFSHLPWCPAVPGPQSPLLWREMWGTAAGMSLQRPCRSALSLPRSPGTEQRHPGETPVRYRR